TGRSELSVQRQSVLKELQAFGRKVEYQRVDVSNLEAVKSLIESIQGRYGNLDGIIHSAGVILDNFILKKSEEEFRKVLQPKVTGTINLDRATQGIALDFFVLFSSGAGAMGNTGQADYATANAFMDWFAVYRNSLVESKERKGQTLSINWPLWKEGGMGIDAANETIMRQTTGMIAMQTGTGIRAFYQSLSSQNSQVVVMEGDLMKMRSVLLKPERIDDVQVGKEDTVSGVDPYTLEEKTGQYLKKEFSSLLKLPANKIDENVPFEKYGIDSILAMNLTNQLEKSFGSLSKTLFFEYQTIKELTRFFIESYEAKLASLFKKYSSGHDETELKIILPAASVLKPESERRRRISGTRTSGGRVTASESLDIAIVGISGRYPGAEDIHEFWEKLRSGTDCVTEIPEDRWDNSLYFDEDKDKAGKTYSKWGGFLDGVDQFDPLFFNISPREAEIMDPKVRLFLETVWNLLEGTGNTRDSLHRKYQGRIGVYVGAMYQQYHSFDSDMLQKPVVSLSSYSSIANRISHFFNFQGPSVAIDTMCSSSLISIHMACESLIRSECKMAIAGGVNLSIHPDKYLGLSQSKMIASHVNSRSFGDGDGYIPSEGVGAVLLKPLARAIEEGDSILAVIKSTSTNHGGHTHGVSVPNLNVQAQLIEDNFIKSGLDPRTVSYVESAATGSSLGDPVELKALSNAFGKFTSEKQFCAIGSVKSNIGHAEAASGISQLTKVVLQLQHKHLVPSIMAEPLNPNLSFDDTPFYLQREFREWKKPIV
ncbi:MAG: SDR family NAD(P)-dependent oxidoreductase, partial [Planctomycetes bacterium]|nr:SDR family NAD(P)-dependent oxidoreductase [Planctomycetota bacterium]